jgi:hypothetical protein
MSSGWYYSVNGQQQGPFSEKQLIDIFHKPETPGPEALVFHKEVTGGWIKATKIDGLLPDVPVRPRLRKPVEPTPQPPSPSPYFREKEKSIYHRTWLWLFMGVAFIVGAVITLSLLSKYYHQQTGPTPIIKVALSGNVTMEVIRCPAGSFMMGSPNDEPGRNKLETQHKETVAKPFWLGKTEVTQAQWQTVMGNNSSAFKGNDLPVERISWNAAVSFCKKLTDLEAARIPAGYAYRLPTEVEWEYACRSGSSSAYGGTGCLDDMGWCETNSGKKTHPVGTKKPNAWGLYDMHGNVCEWCLDKDAYGGRVNRGGGWGHDASRCRAAACYLTQPDDESDDLGFRVILAPVVP